MAILEQIPKELSDSAKRVVVLGGGFAGLNAAKSLCDGLSADLKEHRKVEVLVLNRNNYHLFTPMLYQMSTGLVQIGSIAQPIRPQAIDKGFQFLEVDVKSINVQAQIVYTEERYIPYDYLVIALGTVKDDSKVEGASKYAIPLKTLEDGRRIHNRIVESFEKAALLADSPEREEYLTFVIIGGSTGVELAGSIVDYVNNIAQNYPRIDARRDCKIYVIEAGDRLFPGGDPSLSDVVKQSLEDRGVRILLKTRVEKIEHTKISLSNGESMRTWNIFDNSGVKPNAVLETVPEDIMKKEKGKIVVDEFLRVPKFENVFAIGDNAAVVIGKHHDGKASYAPPTAESAVEEGKFVGEFLSAELNAKLGSSKEKENVRSTAEDKVGPFRYKEKGTMISIGSHTGVAKFPNFTFTGVVGWLIWRIVHLYLLATARAKLVVSFDWILDLFGSVNSSQIL